jgi:hypothetical protein
VSCNFCEHNWDDVSYTPGTVRPLLTSLDCHKYGGTCLHPVFVVQVSQLTLQTSHIFSSDPGNTLDLVATRPDTHRGNLGNLQLLFLSCSFCMSASCNCHHSAALLLWHTRLLLNNRPRTTDQKHNSTQAAKEIPSAPTSKPMTTCWGRRFPPLQLIILAIS